MKFSEQWLREWVNPRLTTMELANQLSLAGLEIEGHEPAAATLSKVVIGFVEEVQAHPDADRLRVCRVQVSAEADPLLTIVCGASNVCAGIRVPVAMVGAELPGGLTISRSKLRGILSEGMICSENELGFNSEKSPGIWILPADAPIGMNLTDYLNTDDAIIEVSITPNRSDCLSVLGMAREVAALNNLPLLDPTQTEKFQLVENDYTIPLNNTVPDACWQYHGILIEQIDNTLSTPLWLRERLRRSGIRSHNLIVDITNYVMIELGQPLHAFDADHIHGGIVVRLAKNNEPLVLLNGNTINLAEDCLVIADEKQVLALAGVMGGQNSAVTEKTTRIFLESALFAPQAIVNRARRYGLHTDSSLRFERGVDPAMPLRALQRTLTLLKQCLPAIKSGHLVSQIAKSDDQLMMSQPIRVSVERINTLLGLALSAEEIAEKLRRLGATVQLEHVNQTEAATNQKTVDLLVMPPAFRHDLKLSIDIVEEVARLYGYDQLPCHLPPAINPPEQPLTHVLDSRLLMANLIHRGYREVITYNFVSDRCPSLLWPNKQSIAVRNPLSPELSIMRASLWAGLLQTTSENNNRQQSNLRLVEMGRVYENRSGKIYEAQHLAGLVMGQQDLSLWGQQRGADFYDVKGDVAALLNSFQVTFKENAQQQALHPRQSAQIIVSGVEEAAGSLGVIHPDVAKAYDLPLQTLLFELNLDILARALPQQSKKSYVPVSKFPEIHRDLAFVVQQELAVGQMLDQIREIKAEILVAIAVFDVYQGKPLAATQKSVGLGLTFLHPSRTLQDEEVNCVVDKIIDKMQVNFQATLRE